MKMDVKSNYTLAVGLAAASYTAGAQNGVEVSHADHPSASFLISVGTVGAGGTVDAKLQYKNAAGSWVDEPDTTAGNSTSITQITAPGSALLHVVNPRGTASRPVITVAVAACVVSVANVAGPKRHVAA